jgi:hypothetical protein
MAYVALSRVRSAAGLRLTDYAEDRITADSTVADYYRRLEATQPTP